MLVGYTSFNFHFRSSYRKEIEVSKYTFGSLVRSSFHCSQDLNQIYLRRDQWNPQHKKHMFALSYELNNPNHIYLTSVIETTTICSLYFYKFHSWYPSITFIPNYDLDILYTDMKVKVVTPRFPNNVNNTNNQSVQRKMECHTTIKI